MASSRLVLFLPLLVMLTARSALKYWLAKTLLFLSDYAWILQVAVLVYIFNLMKG